MPPFVEAIVVRVRAACSTLRRRTREVPSTDIHKLAVRSNHRISGLTESFNLYTLSHGSSPVSFNGIVLRHVQPNIVDFIEDARLKGKSWTMMGVIGEEIGP